MKAILIFTSMLFDPQSVLFVNDLREKDKKQGM